MEDDDDETHLTDLPEEVLLLIFSFLKVLDIIRIGCTCRSLRDVTCQDIIWRQRFRSKNEHLLSLPTANNKKNSLENSSNNNNNNNSLGTWKKLYIKACYALSFRHRTSNKNGERLCAEFITKSDNMNYGIRFDNNTPSNMTIEIWVKLDQQRPDGIIIGCQSESVRSLRWPQYHWQILHVGPDRCVRGSMEPYKFMKGPPLDDEWHHIAITGSHDQQALLVDGNVVGSINFGIGHEYHRYFMRYCQLGNGVISHGALTPWTTDAMPLGKCGWYPFHGMVRELRIWNGKLPVSAVKQNMYTHRVDLLSHDHDCSLIGYWPMNRLVSGPWPWQGSLVSCTSHLEEHRENTSHLKTLISALP